MIVGNTIGAILKNPETIILRTDDGQEYAAAMTMEEVILSADVDDVREGETFASQQGVKTGEKYIPNYHTTQGQVVILEEEEYRLTNLSTYDLYDFTKFEVMVCDYNTSMIDSTAVHTVSLSEKVYEVKSAISIADVSKNHTDKSISLGIVNKTGKPQILRYFTYKET